MHDLKTPAGQPFDDQAYGRIPQLIYTGDQDILNSTLDPPGAVEPGEVWASHEQMRFMLQTFGSPDPTRLRTQVHYLNRLGYSNLSLLTKAGIGHNERPFTDDVLAFLRAHI